MIKRTGLGRSIIGGVLFGNTGAIVGAMTGKEKDISYVNILMVEVKLRLDTGKKTSKNIPLIMGKTKRSSLMYKDGKEKAERILRELDKVAEINSQK